MVPKLFFLPAFFFFFLPAVFLYGQGSDVHGLFLKTLAEAQNRYVGSAVSVPALYRDSRYRKILASEFNAVTPENTLKFKPTESQRNVFTFTDGDAIVEFAESHHMKIRGHTLVWHQSLPLWLTEGKFSKKELEDILHNHIKAVVGHFKGRVYSWDVVNEAITADGSFRHNIWYDTIGPQYIEMSFQWAHESDPDALLFYNDYDCETINKKSDAIYALIKKLKSENIPIGGMGFQSHFNLGSDLTGMDANVKRFAALGLETDFTELDVSIVKGPQMSEKKKLEKQADIYKNIFSDCLNNPSCKMIVLWGFSDAHNWKRVQNAHDAAAVYDEHYRPKPALGAILKALEKI